MWWLQKMAPFAKDFPKLPHIMIPLNDEKKKYDHRVIKNKALFVKDFLKPTNLDLFLIYIRISICTLHFYQNKKCITSWSLLDGEKKSMTMSWLQKKKYMTPHWKLDDVISFSHKPYLFAWASSHIPLSSMPHEQHNHSRPLEPYGQWCDVNKLAFMWY